MFKKNKKVDVIDPITKGSSWYLADAKSDVVKTKLAGTVDGTFAVRNSASEPGKYVLAYSLGGVVKNTHINGDPGKVHLKKATQTFSCMSEMLKYYSENEAPELPVMLCGADFSMPTAPASAPKASAPKPDKKEKKKKTEPGMRGSQWKTQDVCDWLESIHLGEYIVMFKKQKVDGAALLALNDNDLRTLGVSAFGARKKLTQAITTLNSKFAAMDKGGAAPPGLGGAAPVTTIGLIARKIDGEVKIFDIETGQQVFDIAAHQAERAERGPPPQAVMAPERETNAVQTSHFGDNDHLNEQWFDRTLAKAKAIELISELSDGEFVVYGSGSNPGCFALSYVAQGQVQHKLIESSDGGYSMKGVSQEFSNICTVIDFFTKATGGVLKCSLIYPRARRNLIEITKVEAWNCLDLDKPQALARIDGKPAGSFVVRPSEKSYAAISIIKPDGSLYHQHIEETAKGLQLKKSSVGHVDLNAFVTYYKNPSQADLPCALI